MVVISTLGIGQIMVVISTLGIGHISDTPPPPLPRFSAISVPVVLGKWNRTISLAKPYPLRLIPSRLFLQVCLCCPKLVPADKRHYASTFLFLFCFSFVSALFL